MSKRWILPSAITILAATSMGLASTAHANRVHPDIHITGTTLYQVFMDPGETRSWYTTDLSPGTDTVLHLWDEVNQIELAYNDDSRGLSSSITYRNNSRVKKSLLLFVRAANNDSIGTADLVDGRNTVVNDGTVGGAQVWVPIGSHNVYETALAPGGPSDPELFTIDCSGHMVGFGRDGGVGLNGRVANVPDACKAVVYSADGAEGPVNIYANDVGDGSDGDGDGLGRSLEAQLGTCDNTVAPGCGDVYNTQDTDHDGLTDEAEVFGVDDMWSPQHLPRWGADPLHKDMFVEVDYQDVFDSMPLQPSDVAELQAYFAAGLASDLANPDGEDGVHLHLDIGVEPTDPADLTLYGDWGGSNEAPEGTSYKVGPNTYREPVRAQLFRYAMLAYGHGGGQGWMPGDRLGYHLNSTDRFPETFAHELGHTMNLNHYGHKDWGAANCKPNYPSLMNYVQADSFSQGDNPSVLYPSVLSESSGLGPDTNPLYLTEPPWFRQVSGTMVDWDFSGDFSGGGGASTRAAVTFATYKGCNAMDMNTDVVHAGEVAETSPALVYGPDERVYVFYVGADNHLYYRHGKMDGIGWDGSCPGGGWVGDTCTSFSDAQKVPTLFDVMGADAAFWNGELVVAYRTSVGSLRVMRSLSVTASGDLTGWSRDRPTGGLSTKEPELVPMYVDGAHFDGQQTVLAMLYLDKLTGEYHWSTRSPEDTTFGAGSAMRDGNGDRFAGGQAPGAASWPPFTGRANARGTTCGVLTDVTSQVRFYCYDQASNQWIDQTDTAFSSTEPTAQAKVDVTFRPYRHYSGTPMDEARGQFWFTSVGSQRVAWLWMSSTVDTDKPPTSGLSFPKTQRGVMGSVSTDLIAGSGAILLDDPALGATKAVWITDDGKVSFLPLADGTFTDGLSDGNDFQVMERGICLGLIKSTGGAAAAEAFCGTASDSKWGL